MGFFMKKTVLITDLDNTLFDWFEVWYNSFNAMLESVVNTSGISRETLIPEIKAIHQKHGTAEYAFLLEELPSLNKKYGDRDAIRKEMNEAIENFRNERKKHLCLYPTVKETLIMLKRYNVRVVGYTESKEYYSNYRLHQLGLDGLIDVLYSPPDHKIPDYKNNKTSGLLLHTINKHTPENELKPNPALLLHIINEIGAVPEECLYIGDSKMKDIAMAQDAGVTDVFAEYGISHFNDKKDIRYDLLRDVTHWTDEDVEREKKINSNGRLVVPSFVAKQFSDIIPFFLSPSEELTKEEKLKIKVDIWKTVVNTQQHFNDLEMRIRNFAILILSAFIGAIGVSFKSGFVINFFDIHIAASAILNLAAAIIWMLFYFMDVYWYHPLLKGSVEQGMRLEKNINYELNGLIGLAQTITDKSPRSIWFWRNLRSTGKAKLFYKSIFFLLVISSILLFLADVPSPKGDSQSLKHSQYIQPNLI